MNEATRAAVYCSTRGHAGFRSERAMHTRFTTGPRRPPGWQHAISRYQHESRPDAKLCGDFWRPITGIRESDRQTRCPTKPGAAVALIRLAARSSSLGIGLNVGSTLWL